MIDWFETQDKQITDSFKQYESIWNNESNLRRIWGRLDELIMQKHLYNIHTLIKREQELNILDIGCGEGKLLYYLRFHYNKIKLFGIDSNPESIKRAKEVLPSNIILEKSKFIDLREKYVNYFDIIICSEVIEHVENYRELLETIYMILKKDGYVSISTPSGWMYRMPTLTNLKSFIKDYKKFKRLYLFPEKNWPDAVNIHPAIFPKTLIKIMKEYEFSLVLRQSSLWLMYENNLLYRLCKYFEKRNKFGPAFLIENYYRILEAIMNLCPILRIFESRVILLMKKNNLPVQ